MLTYIVERARTATHTSAKKPLERGKKKKRNYDSCPYTGKQRNTKRSASVCTHTMSYRQRVRICLLWRVRRRGCTARWLVQPSHRRGGADGDEQPPVLDDDDMQNSARLVLTMLLLLLLLLAAPHIT